MYMLSYYYLFIDSYSLCEVSISSCTSSYSGVCEGEDENPPENPTSNKELSIWENKNSKVYALIVALVKEEVSHHIAPFTKSFNVLKNLKDLYDSHSELEVVKLMIKLVNIKLKDDDSLGLASQIRAIMHAIDAT